MPIVNGRSLALLATTVFATVAALVARARSEATYDRTAAQWSVPIEASIGKLTKFGSQQVNLDAGVHFWAPSLESGPKGWGFSFTTTLLYPQ